MSKFRAKSPIVDAVVIDEKNEKTIKGMLDKNYPPPMLMQDGTWDFWTPNGIIRARPGDFMVMGMDGYITIFRPEAFANGFEVIPETDTQGKKDFAEAEDQLAALKRRQMEETHGKKAG